MTRTLLAASALVLSFATLLPAQEAPADRGRTYRVRQTTRLSGIPDRAGCVRWWVTLPSDDPYQRVLDLDVKSALGSWRIVRDVEGGNSFLYLEIARPGTQELEVVCEFSVHREPVRVAIDPSKVGPLTAKHRLLFHEELRQDAPHMEVTPEVARIAARVCGKETHPAVQVRKLLDHVIERADHYSKDPSKPHCGVGDAEDCLTNGGGCCTDLHSLFIALARAQGIPARLQMGYRMLDKNLGKEVDPGYRCWAEYFLPGYGWIPTDVVEADAASGPERERWLSGLSEQRVWLNQGRGFVLNPQAAAGRVNLMSIGHAEIDGVAARVLPEGDLLPQLHRKTLVVELKPGSSAALALEGSGAGSGKSTN